MMTGEPSADGTARVNVGRKRQVTPHSDARSEPRRTRALIVQLFCMLPPFPSLMEKTKYPKKVNLLKIVLKV